MPCTMGMEGYNPDYEARRENERLTRISCDIMRVLEASGMDVSMFSPETKNWWEQHKASDERRAKAAEEQKNRERMRADALAKLTGVERRILGL